MSEHIVFEIVVQRKGNNTMRIFLSKFEGLVPIKSKKIMMVPEDNLLQMISKIITVKNIIYTAPLMVISY